MIQEALQAGASAVGAATGSSPLTGAIPFGSPTASSHAYGDALGGQNGSGGLTEAVFNQALQKLIAAAGGKVTVTSGKRTRQRQEELWEEALVKYGDPEVADDWVARPGNSRHESGLAADLKFADEETRRLVHEIAAQFGLYFPLDNEDWHIELRGTRG